MATSKRREQSEGSRVKRKIGSLTKKISAGSGPVTLDEAKALARAKQPKLFAQS